eukprot:COSAG06_NODE_29592_length_553_cov_2.306167_1_plen_83_part_00
MGAAARMLFRIALAERAVISSSDNRDPEPCMKAPADANEVEVVDSGAGVIAAGASISFAVRKRLRLSARVGPGMVAPEMVSG